MLQGQLERRRRVAARVALYGSLALVTAVAWGLVAFVDRPLRARASEQWIRTDYPHLPVVKLFRDYVRIDTSPTTGDEVAGARFLAARLAEAGIPSHLEHLDGRHANLWAILEGDDPRALVLHNHIDVTPVDPREWFVPPFEGRIELPWIYGRGVFDMKSVAIAQLESMIALKKSGRRLKRSVMFLATGGEEYGSFLGTQWILGQHPELVRRFWTVLTEGGTVEARTRSDIKYWGTEFAQKHFVEVAICSPDKKPLEDLRDLLSKEGHAAVTGLSLAPEVRDFLTHYAASRDSREIKDLLSHPERLLHDPVAFKKLPPYMQSMFRNETVPFRLLPAEGGGWQLDVKLHLLPGVELATVRDELLPPWMIRGFAVTWSELPVARHGSPIRHPALDAIYAEIEHRYPEAVAGPMFLSWTATDSRFFRQAGIPSYGFSPFLIMNTDTLQVDNANERMALPGFVDGVALYADVVRRLAL
jgi:acetylornithine deacetylase/succinyl-diaminopimelate desuccinylase-like protein